MTPRMVFLGVLALGLAGCGASTWPASGRVVFKDGTPVTSGVIEFAPEGGGATARGAIGPDGRFTLTTGNVNGAAAGTHRIVIVQIGLADGFASHVKHKHQTSTNPKATRFVDPRYRQFDTSGLTRGIEPHKNNDFVIEVESDD